MACERVLRLSDPTKKNLPEGTLEVVVEAEVRALLHHIEGVSKVRQMGGIWPVEHFTES